MSESERYRFGEIDLPQSELPSPQEVKQAIDALDDEFDIIRRREPDPASDGERVFREKGRTTYVGDTHGDLSFCHFMFVADTEDSFVVRNDEGEEEEISQQRLVRPRVFYCQNGMFAIESLEGLTEQWALRFIGEITDTPIEGQIHMKSFNQDAMKDFYETRDKITVFKFGAPENEEFETDSPLARSLNELTQDVESQEFSGGNAGKNLKGTEIVEEAAENMYIKKLHGKRDDGYTMNILASGVFKATWSESDWQEPIETQKRAEEIFNRLDTQFRRLN